MPDVNYLNQPFAFLDDVVNQDRTVHQFADLGTLTNRSSHSRKARKQIQMIKQRVSETHCRLGIILGNVADDLREIVQRSLREAEVVVH